MGSYNLFFHAVYCRIAAIDCAAVGLRVAYRRLRLPSLGDDVWQGLVDRSVLVRNCASWPRLQGCLRVTIGTPYEDDRFLEALTEVLT